MVVASRLVRLADHRLEKKATSVVGLEQDSLESEVAERRMRDKIKAILDNPAHPLHNMLWQMCSSYSHQIIPPRCKMESFRRSFVPSAISL